jgi:protein-S-isoprenylcysteine O-methyltransferase Ste14
MRDLLFIAGFLATFTGYLIHTGLHYRAHFRKTERLTRGAEALATVIIFIGYTGFGLMLVTDPGTLQVPDAVTILGGLLGFLGVMLFILAVRSKHGLTETEAIVTTGLYARLRHPMYLGILLIHFGFPILFHSTLTLLTVILWAPQILIWRHWEDEDLENRFGVSYQVYKRRTFF